MGYLINNVMPSYSELKIGHTLHMAVLAGKKTMISQWIWELVQWIDRIFPVMVECGWECSNETWNVSDVNQEMIID